jgi:hypothetical protein
MVLAFIKLQSLWCVSYRSIFTYACTGAQQPWNDWASKGRYPDEKRRIGNKIEEGKTFLTDSTA